MWMTLEASGNYNWAELWWQHLYMTWNNAESSSSLLVFLSSWCRSRSSRLDADNLWSFIKWQFCWEIEDIVSPVLVTLKHLRAKTVGGKNSPTWVYSLSFIAFPVCASCVGASLSRTLLLSAGYFLFLLANLQLSGVSSLLSCNFTPMWSYIYV